MNKMLNVEIKAPQIEALTGHTFTNKRICVEAIQMAAPQTAIIYDGAFHGLENNKRLAVLGDVVLAKMLCTVWYDARDQRGNALSLAQWTELRNGLLANDALARRGYSLGVDKCVIVAESTPIVSAKMVATTLEAIIGAVYEDGGDDAVQRVMEHVGFFNHRLLTILAWLPPKSSG